MSAITQRPYQNGRKSDRKRKLPVMSLVRAEGLRDAMRLAPPEKGRR